MMWLEEDQLQARFLIHDRESEFSAGFRRLSGDSDIRCRRFVGGLLRHYHCAAA